MNRRDFLALGTLPAWLAAPTLGPASTVRDRRLGFRLKETAGLRRFSYPVHATLPEEATPRGLPDDGFRLERRGREVSAQFRRVKRAEGGTSVALDFNASPGPFDIEDYTVRFDEVPKADREPGRGMRTRRDGSILEVSNPPYITHAIANDLAGFVRSVRTPAVEFLQGDSPGLFLGFKDHVVHIPIPARASGRPGVEVARQGPLAIGLQSREELAPAGLRPVVSTIDLTFPSSKSWIEANWTIEDPLGLVETMGVNLALRLDGSPTLVDCGASSTVYSTLNDRELMTFEASGPPPTPGLTRSWVVRHGTSGRLLELAKAMRAPGNEPEGWVHVMDRNRCTAMAVADFGRRPLPAVDRFEIHRSGHLQLERRFLNEKTGPNLAKEPKKSLRFWLHFVTTPVQVGAATSPQSMMAPLEVEWIEPTARVQRKGK